MAVGYFLRFLLSIGKSRSLELDIRKQEIKAEEKAQKIISKAQDKAERLIEEARRDYLNQEELIESRAEDIKLLEQRMAERERSLSNEKEVLEANQAELEEKLKAVDAELAEIANMSKQEARQELFDRIEDEYQQDVLIRLNKLEKAGKKKIERRANEILINSIERLGTKVNTQALATSVELSSDSVKGKIIGKDGRNIKAFERVTGVDVIIDDEPGVVKISSFDPVRRAVAVKALDELIADGRIQPARIEEVVEKADKEVAEIIRREGEEAALDCRVIGIDENILRILGRLHFRTSYGHNVLTHSKEVALLSGMIAEEIGANPEIARAAGLLHDIGKALDHEAPGSHIEIGIRILEKFGTDERIITAMKSHHDDYPHESPEAVVVQVADHTSGARPGARKDTLESYLQRLEELENLALSHEGVHEAYAIQAGREIRVFVSPDSMNDKAAKNMAREIARRIEDELSYPGEIKVTVIRETRVTEYAR